MPWAVCLAPISWCVLRRETSQNRLSKARVFIQFFPPWSYHIPEEIRIVLPLIPLFNMPDSTFLVFLFLFFFNIVTSLLRFWVGSMTFLLEEKCITSNSISFVELLQKLAPTRTCISIATVMGPTPPGTGVMKLALSLASLYATSPTIFFPFGCASSGQGG